MVARSSGRPARAWLHAVGFARLARLGPGDERSPGQRLGPHALGERAEADVVERHDRRQRVDPRRRRVEHARDERAVFAEEDLRPRVFEDVRHLLADERLVHRHHDSAGEEARHVGGHPLLARVAEDGHAVPAGDAARDELGGERANAARPLLPEDRLPRPQALEAQGGSLRISRSGRLEERDQRLVALVHATRSKRPKVRSRTASRLRDRSKAASRPIRTQR